MNPTSTLFFALALVIAAFSGGWVVRDWKAGADMADVLAQAAKDQAARRAQVDAAAAGHEKYRKAAAARERVVIKEVERVIEKPVYNNLCFEPDGLRIIAQDIAARTAPSEPAPTVPDPARPYPTGQPQRVPVESQLDPSL